MSTMPMPTAQKKVRVFSFVPSNGVVRRYRERPARTRTGEELCLDDDMRVLFDRVRDEEGDYPTPEFKRVVRGDGWPWRMLARYIVRAAKKGADESAVLAIIDRLAQFARDVFRRYGSARRAA